MEHGVNLRRAVLAVSGNAGRARRPGRIEQAMNPTQLILILDAAALITCIWCFDAMAQGRKLLSADYQPEPTPSELYAAQSDWRR